MEKCPSAYTEGYAKTRLHMKEAADNYIRHTTIGDPLLDPIMEEISSIPAYELHAFVEAGIEQQDDDCPAPLRQKSCAISSTILKRPPVWLDHESFKPGVKAFHEQAEPLIIAFVTGVMVEGFSTLIAKSFVQTGRMAATPRRLQQNLRQLLEIFYPDGLLRENDGWKISVRIRFVHARIRSLLAKSGDWDYEAWGTPVSAANLGLAISIFSKRLLDYTSLLGGRFNTEEKESVLAVWRYAGYLMGIPETILYTDGADAEKIYKLAYMCEPEPDADSAVMANASITVIPGVGKIDDSVEQQNTLDLAYRISRALLGDKLADQYQFPKKSILATLLLFRIKQFFKKLWYRRQRTRLGNFSQLLDTLDLRSWGHKLQDAQSRETFKIKRVVSDACIAAYRWELAV